MSNFVEPHDIQYKDKLDPKYIFNNQIVRCLQLIDTPMFQNNVEALAKLLPNASYLKVTSRRKDWIKEIWEFEYLYAGPIKLGTPEKPIMAKIPGSNKQRYPIPYIEDEDGNTIIDWDDPHIDSPKLVQKESPDYLLFLQLIMGEAETVGLTWKSEATNSEYGLYPEENEELDLGTPTPLDDPKKNEPQEQNGSQHICWIRYKGKLKKVTNYHGYACGIDPGEKPWFFNELSARMTKQKPIVIMITATQGEGKTYTAIRLAEILDKRFDPTKQIAMQRRDITFLVSGRAGLKRNQCIIVDESQWGASAREWGKKDQIKLMRYLAAARFKGYIIIIVALHRSMLDSIIRDRIINYHIHMEERGRATVYAPNHQRFDEPSYPTRRGGLLLQLPDYDACDYVSCLGCKEDETCQTIRAVYERNKTDFVEGEADKDAREEMAAASQDMTEKELAEIAAEYIDKIGTNASGFYDVSDIQAVLYDEAGLEVSVRKTTRVRAFLMRIKPPPHQEKT